MAFRDYIKIYRTETTPDGAGGFLEGEPSLIYEGFAKVSSRKQLRIIEAEQITFREGVKIEMWAADVELRPGDAIFRGDQEFALQGSPNEDGTRGRMWELTALSV